MQSDRLKTGYSKYRRTKCAKNIKHSVAARLLIMINYAPVFFLLAERKKRWILPNNWNQWRMWCVARERYRLKNFEKFGKSKGYDQRSINLIILVGTELIGDFFSDAR